MIGCRPEESWENDPCPCKPPEDWGGPFISFPNQPPVGVPPETPPIPTTGLPGAPVLQAEYGSVLCSWVPTTTGGLPITQYVVEKLYAVDLWFAEKVVDGSILNATLSRLGLVPHSLRVRARNANGFGPPSNVVELVPPATPTPTPTPTVTPTPPPTPTPIPTPTPEGCWYVAIGYLCNEPTDQVAYFPCEDVENHNEGGDRFWVYRDGLCWMLDRLGAGGPASDQVFNLPENATVYALPNPSEVVDAESAQCCLRVAIPCACSADSDSENVFAVPRLFGEPTSPTLLEPGDVFSAEGTGENTCRCFIVTEEIVEDINTVDVTLVPVAKHDTCEACRSSECSGASIVDCDECPESITITASIVSVKTVTSPSSGGSLPTCSTNTHTYTGSATISKVANCAWGDSWSGSEPLGDFIAWLPDPWAIRAKVARQDDPSITREIYIELPPTPHCPCPTDIHYFRHVIIEGLNSLYCCPYGTCVSFDIKTEITITAA